MFQVSLQVNKKRLVRIAHSAAEATTLLRELQQHALITGEAPSRYWFYPTIDHWLSVSSHLSQHTQRDYQSVGTILNEREPNVWLDQITPSLLQKAIVKPQAARWRYYTQQVLKRVFKLVML